MRNTYSSRVHNGSGGKSPQASKRGGFQLGSRPSSTLYVFGAQLEEWAEISGFPNYQVSNHGRVYNVARDQFLSPGFSSENILRVTLYADGVAYIKYVHQLVAQAFHPSYRGRLTWADRNRQNNRADNIIPREVLPQDPRPRRDGWGRRVQIIETGEVFRTVGDCARYINGDYSKIYACLRGERNHHLGYTFRYYEESR